MRKKPKTFYKAKVWAGTYQHNKSLQPKPEEWHVWSFLQKSAWRLAHMALCLLETSIYNFKSLQVLVDIYVHWMQHISRKLSPYMETDYNFILRNLITGPSGPSCQKVYFLYWLNTAFRCCFSIGTSFSYYGQNAAKGSSKMNNAI